MNIWRHKQCLLAGYEGRTKGLIPQWITCKPNIYIPRPSITVSIDRRRPDPGSESAQGNSSSSFLSSTEALGLGSPGPAIRSQYSIPHQKTICRSLRSLVHVREHALAARSVCGCSSPTAPNCAPASQALPRRSTKINAHSDAARDLQPSVSGCSPLTFNLQKLSASR